MKMKNQGIFIKQCCECKNILGAHVLTDKNEECVSHGYCPLCLEKTKASFQNRKLIKELEKDMKKNYETLSLRVQELKGVL